MKPVYILLLVFFVPVFCFSQQRLDVQGTGNALYLEHKVSKGDNYYSIARMFNVPPAELASYNHQSMSKGLLAGQTLKIPLTLNNFVQSTSANSSSALIPLYHTVAAGETLFRIGVNYKNVSLEDLKQWNEMNTDQVNKNASLIIGFLKVDKAQSPLAKNEFKPSLNGPGTQVQENVAMKNEPAKEVVAEKKEPAKEVIAEKKESAKETVQEVKKENPKDENVADVSPVPEKSTATSAKEGFFKGQFTSGSNSGDLRSANAITSVFKSTSGWQDGKYYCFSNEAKPGSIIKVSYTQQNTTVYAKVLDAIPDIKQNDGVNLVLSNAAADALGAKDDHFEVIINYVK